MKKETYLLISPIVEGHSKEQVELIERISAKMENNECPTAGDIDEYTDCMEDYHRRCRDQFLIYVSKIEVLESFYKDDLNMVAELKVRKERTMERIKEVDDQWLNFKADWRAIRTDLAKTESVRDKTQSVYQQIFDLEDLDDGTTKH